MPPNNDNQINFFGFDSFDGFGELEDNDLHPFMKMNNSKPLIASSTIELRNLIKTLILG